MCRKKLFIQGIFFEEFHGKQRKNYTSANFVADVFYVKKMIGRMEDNVLFIPYKFAIFFRKIKLSERSGWTAPTGVSSIPVNQD